MTAVLISFPNGQQIIGDPLEETEKEIIIENPIQIGFSNPWTVNTTVYSSRYMPFAKDAKVVINKLCVVSYASVNDDIDGFYRKTIKLYNTRTMNYVHGDDPEEPSSSNQIEEVVEALVDKKHKTVH